MKKYALRFYKDIDGKPTWFRSMCGIGPQFTNKPEEAARFDSERAAMESPAFTFSLAPVNVCEAPTV